MSQRNDYNYFDLDNFDDSFDSRDYRRRQNRSAQGSYNRRPSYNGSKSKKRKRMRRRTRNRILMVLCGILILALIIALITVMFKGCTKKKDTSGVSTKTIDEQKLESTSAAPTAPTLPQDLSTTYFKTPDIEDDGKNGELVYNIYVWKNSGYELFGGTDASAEKYAQTVNALADKLSGVDVYDMIVPNHTEMGLPQRLKDSDASSVSQADNIKSAYAALNDNVMAVNVYNSLADHNKEYIYFKSDHHWTALGAYYAYEAFAESTDQPVLPLDKCTENKIEGFDGSFANMALLDSDTVSYYTLPYSVTMDITFEDGTQSSFDSPYYSAATSGSNTYGVFIIGDNPLTVLNSGSEKATDKKIAVVKESYGNAFVPYLTYNYKEVHVVDFRYFQQDFAQYCKDNGITDVLFINGVMSANTQLQLDSMNALVN